MQTYSHLIITAVLDRRARVWEGARGPAQTRLPPLRSRAFLFGSVAPDLPLILLAVVAMAADLWQGNRMMPGPDATAVHSYTGYLFRYAFFHDPGVKLAHNLFHAPFLIALYLLAGYWAWRAEYKWGATLFWFGLACALHTAIDIPVHYDDGPLIFFPFDWSTRFYGPISYWDAARGGNWFGILEHGLVLVSLAYLGVDWRRRRVRSNAVAEPAE